MFQSVRDISASKTIYCIDIDEIPVFLLFRKHDIFTRDKKKTIMSYSNLSWAEDIFIIKTCKFNVKMISTFGAAKVKFTIVFDLNML